VSSTYLLIEVSAKALFTADELNCTELQCTNVDPVTRRVHSERNYAEIVINDIIIFFLKLQSVFC